MSKDDKKKWDDVDRIGLSAIICMIILILIVLIPELRDFIMEVFKLEPQYAITWFSGSVVIPLIIIYLMFENRKILKQKNNNDIVESINNLSNNNKNIVESINNLNNILEQKNNEDIIIAIDNLSNNNKNIVTAINKHNEDIVRAIKTQ